MTRYKGKTVEKWTALLPAASKGETSRYGVLLVYKKKAVGAYLLEKPSGTVPGLQGRPDRHGPGRKHSRPPARITAATGASATTKS